MQTRKFANRPKNEKKRKKKKDTFREKNLNAEAAKYPEQKVPKTEKIIKIITLSFSLN